MLELRRRCVDLRRWCGADYKRTGPLATVPDPSLPRTLQVPVAPIKAGVLKQVVDANVFVSLDSRRHCAEGGADVVMVAPRCGESRIGNLNCIVAPVARCAKALVPRRP